MLTAHLALAALTAAPADGTAGFPPAMAAQVQPGPVVLALAEPGAMPPAPVAAADDVADPALAQVAAAPTTPAAPSSAPASLSSITLAPAPKFFDPLEPISRLSYAISQPIDRFIIRPAAMVYQTVIPKPARDGARNAISNLSEPIVFLNDLIQFRPKRAFLTLARLIINSAIGLGGLFDIAKRKPFNLPHRDNNFGDTLGYYGIGPIMYFYLPVFGPTTLRDSAGQYGDSYFKDRILHKLIHPGGRSLFFRTQPKLGKSGTILTIISGLDQRAEADGDLKAITEGSVDPYASLRASYLQDRVAEIAGLRAKDGEQPANQAFDDPLLDPEAAKPSASIP